MKLNLELIDFISFLFYACILYFLSKLSKRFGAVMGMKKYYFLYYVGIFFTLSASMILFLSLWEPEGSELFEYGYAFFALGLTLGIIASIKYWGWLIKEIVRG
jgi:hypothetical protein